MKLTTPDVPDEASSALASGLRVLTQSSRNERLLDATAYSESGEIRTFSPLFVFVLDSVHLSDSIELTEVHKSSVRYFVGETEDGSPVSCADVALDRQGNVLGFSRMTHGPIVAGLWQALQTVSELESSSEAELRILEVPAVHVVSLWVATAHVESDHFVQVMDAGHILEQMKVYLYREYLAILSQRAEKFLQQKHSFPV